MCLIEVSLMVNISDPSCSSPWAAPLPFNHPIQQACRQQACATDACLPHTAPPLPPWHSAHHHQLGAPGASQDPEAMEPELSATCTSPPALSCSVLQGGEVWAKVSVTSHLDGLGGHCVLRSTEFRNMENHIFYLWHKKIQIRVFELWRVWLSFLIFSCCLGAWEGHGEPHGVAASVALDRTLSVPSLEGPFLWSLCSCLEKLEGFTWASFGSLVESEIIFNFQLWWVLLYFCILFCCALITHFQIWDLTQEPCILLPEAI